MGSRLSRFDSSLALNFANVTLVIVHGVTGAIDGDSQGRFDVHFRDLCERIPVLWSYASIELAAVAGSQHLGRAK